jgi:hypothetical protein
VHTLNVMFALHVDTTTITDDTYEISQESAEDISEDQVNITKGLSEAPNQSSKDNNTNIPDSSPTSKGKPRCITQYFKLLHYAILYSYIISCIKLISNRCSANRTGRSRVISCHSRDIGIAMFTSCNHYKDDGPELCEVSWLR